MCLGHKDKYDIVSAFENLSVWFSAMASSIAGLKECRYLPPNCLKIRNCKIVHLNWWEGRKIKFQKTEW